MEIRLSRSFEERMRAVEPEHEHLDKVPPRSMRCDTLISLARLR